MVVEVPVVVEPLLGAVEATAGPTMPPATTGLPTTGPPTAVAGAVVVDPVVVLPGLRPPPVRFTVVVVPPFAVGWVTTDVWPPPRLELVNTVPAPLVVVCAVPVLVRAAGGAAERVS